MQRITIALFIALAGCGIGDVGTSSNTNNATVDNSTDNSQHGISSCQEGSSFVCDQAGPDTFTQTEECVNVNGEVVILDGPQVIDNDLADACPTPEPTPIPFQ